MQLALDHVVVIVPSLAEGIALYRDAGFDVVPGGRHDAIPTENALIAFADGTYLELMALRDEDARRELAAVRSGSGWERHLHRASAIGRRFLPALAGPPGVVDWALVAGRLDRFAREARDRGFAMTGPTPFSRERRDGVRLEMELLLPAARSLPFLIADRSPRALRVPAQVGHANGASGIAGIQVRATDIAGAALAFADLFGTSPRAAADGRTHLVVAGADVALEPGEPEGARGVTLRGVGILPAAIGESGVKGAAT
jgi:hypothetical protein